MLLDCIVIGGGPAGMNAGLVLGRAKRKVVVFDDNQPRNAVTHETHGFITRDGVTPTEFRALAYEDVSKYPSVEVKKMRVSSVVVEESNGRERSDGEERNNGEEGSNRGEGSNGDRGGEGNKGERVFVVRTDEGEEYRGRTVLLATGLKETLPGVPGIYEYYGKSVFSCPYCDGWERRDQPLVVITESSHAFHMSKLVWNWSRDLVVCTNGSGSLTGEQREVLEAKGIRVVEDVITGLVGDGGMLRRIEFAGGESIERVGGFVTTQVRQGSEVAEALGCEMNANGIGVAVDVLGRTSVPGVYAAGDAVTMGQLVIAAAEGSRVAAGVNLDLVEREFVVGGEEAFHG